MQITIDTINMFHTHSFRNKKMLLVSYGNPIWMSIIRIYSQIQHSGKTESGITFWLARNSL